MDDLISRQAVDDAIYDYSRSCDVNYAQIMEYIDKIPPVNPQEPKTDALDNILREIEIEDTLADDSPNPIWRTVFKQGLQTVRRIVERYKAESEDKE